MTDERRDQDHPESGTPASGDDATGRPPEPPGSPESNDPGARPSPPEPPAGSRAQSEDSEEGRDPGAPPPPPVDAPPSSGGSGGASDNRTLMIVLAYLYFFCLVPLFVEQEDKEVQWHAKHGLVLLGLDVVLAVAFTMLSAIPVVGCVLIPFWALLHFALFVLRIFAIVKGTQGERLVLPGISPLADKF